MRAPILCLLLVGCGVSGFRVVNKPGAPVLGAAGSTEVVDAPPPGAAELGRVEIIGSEGDACKSDARERARTLLGATYVVVGPHPEPFQWQNTEKATLAAPRCVATAYAAAPGSTMPSPTPPPGPPPPLEAPPIPAPPPAPPVPPPG
jgi:hypothetical protein